MSGIVKLKVDALLEERELSVMEFSQKAGLNYRTALDIVKGHYDRIGLDTIAKICDALHVSPSDLFDYQPDN